MSVVEQKFIDDDANVTAFSVFRTIYLYPCRNVSNNGFLKSRTLKLLHQKYTFLLLFGNETNLWLYYIVSFFKLVFDKREFLISSTIPSFTKRSCLLCIFVSFSINITIRLCSSTGICFNSWMTFSINIKSNWFCTIRFTFLCILTSSILKRNKCAKRESNPIS